tara:strand:+ start:322 stop:447 length:126 start_codon:yes stop_codon:yes gene_type:complete
MEKAAFSAGLRQELPGKSCPIRQNLPGYLGPSARVFPQALD